MFLTSTKLSRWTSFLMSLLSVVPLLSQVMHLGGHEISAPGFSFNLES